MSTTNKGGCLCGAVRFELEADFKSFFLCYCSRCQKGTGADHAANLFTKSTAFTWLSGEQAVKTYLYPGTRHRRSFCQHCGSALPVVEEGLGFIMVPAGCLETPVPIKPTARIFVAEQADWSRDLSEVPSFDAFPT
ncbi:GFA family protein [Marinobacterium litorale]|uniref:GFA family protein n=1 Tax=Marinobacterium litorale TaxID=404770 RepID=UPI000486A394|nr:GFA family protein [Marinobacterium litorale]